MKKITQSAIALSFLGILFMIKRKKIEHEVFTPTFHTYEPEDKPKDFNEWSEHIYRINSKRNNV